VLGGCGPDGVVDRLDRDVVGGHLHRRRQRQQRRLLTPGTYLEPFALRALGRARDDPALIALAVNRFERLGLDWHTSQTRSAR
jgi:hypothetical protein